MLEQLRESGLQSDDRYTENYIASRTQRGKGPIRIRAELRERGVDETLIDAYLQTYDDLWPSLMRQVHDQKFGAKPTTDRKTLAKKVRFLEYRGFPSELIQRFFMD